MPDSPTNAAKHTLRSQARRDLALRAEAKELDGEIQRLVAGVAPEMLAAFGVGPDRAATFLVMAGDNPGRMRSEAAFASLSGSSPVPASSGETTRHRLNRGEDRQANAALHRVVVVRLRWHQPTQAHMARRAAEGRTTAEVMRCLMRHVAREVFGLLRPAQEGPALHPIRA